MDSLQSGHITDSLGGAVIGKVTPQYVQRTNKPCSAMFATPQNVTKHRGCFA